MNTAPGHGQQGHILLTSVIILIAMSLLGSYIFSAGWLESRMAVSWRDDIRTFQLQELALRHVETAFLPTIMAPDPGPWIITVNPATVTGGHGVDPGVSPLRAAITRLPGDDAGIVGQGRQTSSGHTASVRYRIEIMPGGQNRTDSRGLLAVSGLIPGAER